MFRKILLTEGILKGEDTVRMDQYYWSDIVEKLLTEKQDEELAIHVVKETIDLCAGYRLVSKWDSYLKSVMIILINDYFAIVWPFLKTALLSEKEDYDIYFCLKNILGSHISSYGMQESILLQGDSNEILKWCEENLPIAPVRMMSMAPVFSNKTKYGKQSLHPFTRTLLDRFGDLDGILPALQANMGTYSWTGSIVPLINGKIELMAELKNHPIQEVRSWAIKMEEYLKKEMRKESNEDAERFL